ncbi:MAG: hypothetical protein IJX98_07360, partial [Clostridia bacterium]|nr:hypothetical protein [Clostridia bacterium]
YPDGTFAYSDGANVSTAQYAYNFADRSLVFYGARFARFFNGVQLGQEDVEYIGNYQLDQFYLADYKAVLTQTGMQIYDGVFFTSSAPLTATAAVGFHSAYYSGESTLTFYYDGTGVDGTTPFTYTINGTTVTITYGDNTQVEYELMDGALQNATANYTQTHELFQGIWEKTDQTNVSYTFDGMGSWWASDGMSGLYEYANETISFTRLGVSHTATITADGYLCIANGNTKLYFAHQGSFAGEWIDPVFGMTLQLDGIPASGNATGLLTDNNGYTYEITYDLLDGYLFVYISGDLFGFVQYNSTANTLDGTMYYYDEASAIDAFLNGFRFLKSDVLQGEWITDDNELFSTIRFNGKGMYDLTLGGETISGKLNLLVDGVEREVTYTVDKNNALGSFVYENNEYTIMVNEDMNTISIDGTLLQRKDELSAFVFVDGDLNEYVFDGRGALTNGGKVLVNGEATGVGYQITDSGVILSDGANNGSFAVNADGVYCYKLGAKETLLTKKTFYTGEWAIAGAYQTLTVGGVNENGVLKGKYLGKEITLTMKEETAESYITFPWTESGKTTKMYLHNINGAELGLSSYELTYYGFTACTKPDALFGTWTFAVSDHVVYTYRFDGISSSTQTLGVATRAFNATVYECNYRVIDEANGIYLVWDQNVMNNGVAYSFEIQIKSAGTLQEAYISEDGTREFKPVQVDSFYRLEAINGNKTFVFDGFGKIANKANTNEVYAYNLTTDVVFNSALSYATVIATGVDGTRYTITVNYATTPVVLTFVKHERATDTSGNIFEFDPAGTITRLDANGNRTEITYSFNAKTVTVDQTAKTATLTATGVDGLSYTVVVNYSSRTALKISFTAL